MTSLTTNPTCPPSLTERLTESTAAPLIEQLRVPLRLRVIPNADDDEMGLPVDYEDFLDPGHEDTVNGNMDLDYDD
jgi:hypothetical protein